MLVKETSASAAASGSSDGRKDRSTSGRPQRGRPLGTTPSASARRIPRQYGPGLAVRQPRVRRAGEQHGYQDQHGGERAWRDDVFVERIWRSVKHEAVYRRAATARVSDARAAIGRTTALCNGYWPHRRLERQTLEPAHFNVLRPIPVAAQQAPKRTERQPAKCSADPSQLHRRNAASPPAGGAAGPGPRRHHPCSPVLCSGGGDRRGSASLPPADRLAGGCNAAASPTWCRWPVATPPARPPLAISRLEARRSAGVRIPSAGRVVGPEAATPLTPRGRFVFRGAEVSGARHPFPDRLDGRQAAGRRRSLRTAAMGGVIN